MSNKSKITYPRLENFSHSKAYYHHSLFTYPFQEHALPFFSPQVHLCFCPLAWEVENEVLIYSQVMRSLLCLSNQDLGPGTLAPQIVLKEYNDLMTFFPEDDLT